MRSVAHVPPGFETQLRPHIAKVDGHWWAIWPRIAAMPSDETLERVWRPYMNKLNDIIAPQPKSLLYDPHPVIQ